MKPKKALKPVDLSFLADFVFVGDNGHYEDKEVCIMNALYLAVEIAEGRLTLEQALKGQIGVSTSVDCVHDVIHNLAMSANDSFRDDAARKAWALATLPRLLGTRAGGKRQTARIENLRKKFHPIWEKQQAAENNDRARALLEKALQSSVIDEMSVDQALDILRGCDYDEDQEKINVHRIKVAKLDYVLSAIGH